MKIEVYSDVMCPWCYVGERRLQRALAAFPGGDEVEVVYRAFQLDPSAPARPTPMREHLRRKFGPRAEPMQQHVAGVARAEGIEMDFERGVIVATLTAHRLMRLAEREYGAAAQRALAERLFAAHFERGEDVSDHEVLARLAASVGMDAERVRGYLASGEATEETRADFAAAAQRGVRAVPTFVFDGRYAVEGAQPTSTFLKVLEELASEVPGSEVPGSEAPESPEAGGAVCADGGCAR